jgi:hypothetical protein
MMRALSWLLLAALCIPHISFAQEEDDLAPLAPKRPKPVVKPKIVRPRPAVKPVVKLPAEDDDLAPLASAKGEVNVKLPQGLTNAVLSIDNKDVGTLPLGPQTLSLGEHALRVRRAGYADFVKKVNVVGGKTIDLEAKLTALSALLSVTSDVGDAQVFVNGRLVGTAPLREVELPPGGAVITVRKEGFKEDTKHLTLIAGKDYPIVVNFGSGASAVKTDRPDQKKLLPHEETAVVVGLAPRTVAVPPITSRWYFWTGVALGVAAGVVAGILLIPRFFPPLTQEQILCRINGGTCDDCVNFECNRRMLPGALHF